MDAAATLLQYAASVKAESNAGFAPLHLAAQEGGHAFCEMLFLGDAFLKEMM